MINYQPLEQFKTVFIYFKDYYYIYPLFSIHNDNFFYLKLFYWITLFLIYYKKCFWKARWEWPLYKFYKPIRSLKKPLLKVINTKEWHNKYVNYFFYLQLADLNIKPLVFLKKFKIFYAYYYLYAIFFFITFLILSIIPSYLYFFLIQYPGAIIKFIQNLFYETILNIMQTLIVIPTKYKIAYLRWFHEFWIYKTPVYLYNITATSYNVSIFSKLYWKYKYSNMIVMSNNNLIIDFFVSIFWILIFFLNQLLCF